MKKIVTMLCAVLMAVCVSFAFVGCIDLNNDDETSSELSVSNENISIQYLFCFFFGVFVRESIKIKNIQKSTNIF